YSARINRSIESGEFFNNQAILDILNHVQKNKSNLHLVGLLGSGTVHSSFAHLISLIEFAKKNSISNVYLHLFTDGKDSGLKESPALIKKLQGEIQRLGVGVISSIVGRMYSMDRDTNWERTQKAYDLWISGKGEKAKDPAAAIESAYNLGFNDTSLEPIIIENGKSIADNDAIFFFNYREDSMRQISRTFADPEFKEFQRKKLTNIAIGFMTQYFETPGLEAKIAFLLPDVKNGLAEVFSNLGYAQLHIAETEKYAHATYFFNCLQQKPFNKENDILIQSEKDHHAHPEMKAQEIADTFVKEFNQTEYAFTVINFANADILSHSGDLALTSKGIETIDAALGKIKTAILEKDGILVITADHGNAESLIYKETGAMETKHNLNPVPLYLVAKEYEEYRPSEVTDSKGLISDVAPTILALINVEAPVEMTGANLLELIT
ncbi:MAG: 2,3-bisphosphoglycerate-independent phosphoglycerate mutase, partial [Candidatus Liptonbacteria bacterium]|nr:2,3-bisphosphoglycerate-independent phosphoglycerate mutase [Candidatus Liptonbacteria bacterium]